MSLTRKPRRALALVGAVAIASLVGFGAASAASAATPGDADAKHPAKPTIVTVHGAWADASSFAGVTKRLQDDGYTVLNAPNPLRGLASDAASIAAFVNQATTGSVVLVGHSYGGAVITDAATSLPQVKALVYVDAFAPDQGESVVALAGSAPGSVLAGEPADIFTAVQDPSLPDGDPELYVKPAVFAEGFTKNLDKAESQILAASQRPVAGGALQEPSGVPAWKSIPSFFVIGTQDKVIPPAGQQAMAQRAGGTVVTVKAGHLSMLEKPKDVTDLIEKAAKSVK